MSRLVDIGRRKYVSTAGLADVLKDIRDKGMPTAISRSSIKRARDSEFDDCVTPYGPILKSKVIGDDKSGKPCTFWLADSRATMYYLLSESPKLGDFIREKLREHPCSIIKPWSLIIYNDEIAPGDQLLHHNRRKTQAFYYSFLQFGATALSSEFLWFTLSASRSDDVNDIEGRSFGIFAKHQMLAFEEWVTVGFQFHDIIIWAKLEILLCDEAALKYTLDVKGASGSMPCLKCRNVLSKKAFAKSNPDSGMVGIHELEYTAFDKHTDESLVENARHLASMKPSLGVGKFKELETSLGLNYSESGVLLSRLQFKPATGSCYDPQHVYLVNGIFQAELGHLLTRLKKRMKIKLHIIGEFFNSFEWPANSKSGKNIFDDRTDKSLTDTDNDTKKKNLTFSCSASDGLGSFAMLQEFLMLQVFATATAQRNEAVLGACASFFALCAVLTLATMIPRGGVSPELLRAKIVAHLQLHSAAYGSLHWVPKFHYAHHLADQYELWGALLFCFAHERKHKEIKRYLQGRMNTSATWDKNVMQDVLHIQKLALREDFPYPRGTQLLSPRSPDHNWYSFLRHEFPDSTDVLVSIDAKAGNFVTCHVGDVVCVAWDNGMSTGRIQQLCNVDGECMAFVCVWTKLPQVNMFDTRGESYFVLLVDVVDTCVYKIEHGIAYVVPPRGVVHDTLIKKK